MELIQKELLGLLVEDSTQYGAKDENIELKDPTNDESEDWTKDLKFQYRRGRQSHTHEVGRGEDNPEEVTIEVDSHRDASDEDETKELDTLG